MREPRTKSGTKLISISSAGLLTKSNYREFQRFQVVDIEMAADAEATLPAMIEAVEAAVANDRKPAIEKRGETLRKACPTAASAPGAPPPWHGALYAYLQSSQRAPTRKPSCCSIGSV